MNDRLRKYQQAGRKAVEWQISFQRPDGGYIWDGYAVDAYHKQAYSWAAAGYLEPAHRLLTWAVDNTLGEDGQLADYNADVYKHAWFFQGAHRLGRFDVSYRVMHFLLSCQAACGGLPHFAADKYLRSLSTCWTGVGAVYIGRLDVAEATALWALAMLEQQPGGDKFFFCTTRDGELVTLDQDPRAPHIDYAKPKQPYWEIGLPLQLMCRLYMATGREQFLDHARAFFELHFRCHEDVFSYVGSGKSSLGAALYYLLTGDERAREAAYCFADFLLATQYPEGGWRDETEPDTLLIYIDHAAEFNVW
ncbi:MAG: hypothetical protein J7M26_00455, partial [Armatimonadetes bacterium]|nr:hypothetical protein [Armatimonadota bacterium]